MANPIAAVQPRWHKYGMRLHEFAPIKPKKARKPKKPLTPDQSVIAAKKKQIALAKQAMQNVKDDQEQRKEAERTRLASYTTALKKR